MYLDWLIELLRVKMNWAMDAMFIAVVGPWVFGRSMIFAGTL